MARHDLQADRQALAVQPAGNGGGGLTRQVESEGERRPADVDAIAAPRRVLVHRERRHRHGGRQQQVVLGHERVHDGGELLALMDRRHHRLLTEMGADVGRLQQAGIHHLPLVRAETLDQDSDIGLPVRVQDLARVEPLQVGRVLDHLGAQGAKHLDGVFHGDRHIAVDLVALDEAQGG